MNVKSFKLTTGEELVAELLHETGMGYVVKNPLVVHVMRGPDGQGSLAFAQWSMIQTSGAQIELYDHAVLCKPAEIIAEVADSYRQQTSSIVLPKATGSMILTG
jgi:hypothetical protein